jgi:hypothetical protein
MYPSRTRADAAVARAGYFSSGEGPGRPRANPDRHGRRGRRAPRNAWPTSKEIRYGRSDCSDQRAACGRDRPTRFRAITPSVQGRHPVAGADRLRLLAERGPPDRLLRPTSCLQIAKHADEGDGGSVEAHVGSAASRHRGEHPRHRWIVPDPCRCGHPTGTGFSMAWRSRIRRDVIRDGRPPQRTGSATAAARRPQPAPAAGA